MRESYDKIFLGKAGEIGGYQIKQAVIDADTADTHIIVPAVGNRKIRVIGIMLQPLPSDVSLTWLSVDAQSGETELAPGATWLQGSGWSDYWGPHGYFFETIKSESLGLKLGSVAQVGGWLNYIEVPIW